MRRGFDATALVLVASIATIIGLTVGLSFETTDEQRAEALGRWALAEVKPLADRYGQVKTTNWAEEWIARDFFQDRPGGFFLDVGASDYQHASNTYFLETGLGWSGIAIEPQTQYAEGYRLHRPKTKFLPFFVSNVSDESVRLHVPGAFPYAASADREFAERHQRAGPVTASTVSTITLNDLLAREGVERIDYMVMDIELHEPQALAGFDIERFRPSLVNIEAHPEIRQPILNYFHDHGYVAIGKYLRMDPQNLYFTPRLDAD